MQASAAAIMAAQCAAVHASGVVSHTYGPNLIPNTTFDDATNVTLNAGPGGQPAPTVTGGVLDFQGKGNAVETFTSSLTSGATYLLEFDISAPDIAFVVGSAGSFTQSVGGSAGVAGTGISITFVANASHTQIKMQPADVDSPTQLDNVKLRQQLS